MPCRRSPPLLGLSLLLFLSHTLGLFVLTFAAVAMKFSCCCSHAMATSRAQHKANKLCTYTHRHTHTQRLTHNCLSYVCALDSFFTFLFFLFCWFLWGNASLSALGLPELVGLVWARLTSSYSIWARCRVNLARNIWQDDALPRCCLSAEQ